MLQRLRERGLTLNKDKCAFNKSNLDVFGFVFSRQGTSVDPKKVEAICSIAPLQNISELGSLMGLLNYCSKMIPLSLRELPRKLAKWQWTDRQQTAFNMVNGILSSNPV